MGKYLFTPYAGHRVWFNVYIFHISDVMSWLGMAALQQQMVTGGAASATAWLYNSHDSLSTTNYNCPVT